MHLNQTRQLARVTAHGKRLVLITVALCLPGVALSSAGSPRQMGADPQPVVQSDAVEPHSGEGAEAELESLWGVTVIGVHLTAADYMLEFRYRVVDAGKAAYLMDRRIAPELIIEKSGHKLYVPVSPKVGSLRQSPKIAKEEYNYFMLFANPGRVVKAGDKVTVVIGDFNAGSMVVE